MTSLTDVYEGRVGRVASRRQQLFGSGLFLAGAAMLVGAIGVATTGIGTAALSEYAAREVGGILAGIGLQTVLLGVFALLPASRRVRGAAVIGTGVALLGVALFRHVYPYQWVESAPLFALATTTVYFFGVVTTFWCLFVGLATFKTRNDPGGTARMEVTQEGTIRLVEEAQTTGGLGGIGLFGTEPDGSVETQTNTASRSSTASPGASPAVSDGGSAASDGLAEVETNTSQKVKSTTAGGSADRMSDSTAPKTQPDSYCGNCRHFEYVTMDGEPEPYCAYHGEELDDMDACSSWREQSR
jgi:cytochrome c biogenesis protein CcdA